MMQTEQSKMRTGDELRARLAMKKAVQKEALEKHLVWSLTNIGAEIKELQWVLGGDEK